MPTLAGMATNPDDQAEAFLQNRALEKAQAYADRGRRHAQMPTAEVADAWVVAFKVWAADYENPLLRAMVDDLESELTLRGVAPPYERAKEAADKLRAIARALIENLTPEEHSQLSADIQSEVDAWSDAARTAKKN
jgi:hypothetical protein